MSENAIQSPTIFCFPLSSVPGHDFVLVLHRIRFPAMISFLFSIESRPAMIASTAAQMGLVTAEALLEAFNYIEY